MQENEIRQVETMIEKALAKMHDHDISGALEELLQAVEMEPENVRIINLIASCYLILGEFERARACWEMVLGIDEGNRDASNRLEACTAPAFQSWLKRYHNALARMDSRNYKLAAELLRQLMEENDGFVSLYELLGLCYLAVSEVEMARKVWQKGLELDRTNQALLTYLEDKKDSKTIARQQITASNREVAATREKRGFRYYGLVWGAAGVLCLALLIPTSHYITGKQGNSLKPPATQKKIISSAQGEGKEDGASRVMAAADGLNFSMNASGENISGPGSLQKDEKSNLQEEVYYNKGFAAYLKADWEQAAANLKEVVNMQSGTYLNREALYYLARTKYLSGDLDEARKNYLRYLKEFPVSNYYDDSLYYLGCIYHHSGDDKEARKVFKQLQQLEPNSGYLSTNLFKEVMN
ncbi:MAG: tetratricopeptide repeat protein [Syntrophomonadaceae bacterium]|nr:tetratricopeptide repeat protein [Syntrophomonadaceae bacterium]